MKTAILVLPLCLLVACLAAAAPTAAPAGDDVQDVVFLGETRPVLLRLHIRIDGKPLQTAVDDFLRYLFNDLDLNRDGFLSKEEVARAPAVNQLTSGAMSLGFIAPGFGGQQTAPPMDEIDADHDGRVTVAELIAYYRKKGFLPCNFQVEAANFNPAAMAFGGGTLEPTVEQISAGIFKLLDADNDGKLTQAELAAAPSVLLALDSDDDEIITAKELVRDAKPATPNMLAAGMAMLGQGKGRASTGNQQLLLVTTPGVAPLDLVRRIQERYGTKKVDPATKLSRKDLGLDEATFALLDANRDGTLDARELEGFIQRQPDLELAVDIGSDTPSVAATAPAPLTGKIATESGAVTLNLGLTRLGVRSTGSSQEGPSYFDTIVRQQLSGQFKNADKDKSGYLDQKEAEASPQFRQMYKAADRDGDGRLYESEVFAYLDHARELQQRCEAGCATLVLSDQSRGLFDLLDINRDGRLSMREMRGAVKLLGTLAPGRDHFTKADIPRTYQVTMRHGPPGGGNNPAAAFAAIYGPNRETGPAAPTAGPLWFRKMDRNRDGDVSPREFLFSADLFRRIDTDGDGLISAQEAERAGALARKE